MVLIKPGAMLKAIGTRTRTRAGMKSMLLETDLTKARDFSENPDFSNCSMLYFSLGPNFPTTARLGERVCKDTKSSD